jgi:predicted dehydrogenase
MEKPLAVNFEHAQAIARAARDGKIHVLVNYETTWYASNQEVYKLAHQGSFGEIRKMVAHDGHRGPKEIGVQPEFLAWLTDPVLDGGGALMDFGCYGANLMTWLMDNQRPLSVTAVTQQIKPQIYPRVDDEATIILTYPHAQGIIQASWNWPIDRKDIEVYGQTAQALTVKQNNVRFQTAGKPEEQLTSEALTPPINDSINYLTAVVRGQIQPTGLSSLENNLIVSEILDAARRSAKSGQTIKLPLKK